MYFDYMFLAAHRQSWRLVCCTQDCQYPQQIPHSICPVVPHVTPSYLPDFSIAEATTSAKRCLQENYACHATAAFICVCQACTSLLTTIIAYAEQGR